MVRQILANVAGGSTLYGESKRLNEDGVPSPGWRFESGERKYGVAWSPSTIATIVHQSAYSGDHRVKAETGYIERVVPPIGEPGLQKRAEAALQANRHRASARARVRGSICSPASSPAAAAVTLAPDTPPRAGARSIHTTAVCRLTGPSWAQIPPNPTTHRA